MPFPSYRKKRGVFKDLAPMLWYSFGTMAALLQEVLLVYPTLSSPTLSANAASRVCNALGLLQGLSAPCQEEASRANREKWLKSSVGGSDREVC
ncbi:hypothetical protein PVAP13_2KG034416 [Panicum virgatum]|uniref:Uncharacterized protein n=1 Tax=Panicum virgatum TaxID=38727 RepID=A0A8T0W1U1_PANVG|nr:hypothetical protein PVAP13_2KG034416 [Panicum virgatum]